MAGAFVVWTGFSVLARCTVAAAGLAWAWAFTVAERTAGVLRDGFFSAGLAAGFALWAFAGTLAEAATGFADSVPRVP